MIRLTQIKAAADLGFEQAHTSVKPQGAFADYFKARCAKELHVEAGQIAEIRIRRQSLDARRKPDIFYVYTLDVLLAEPVLERERRLCQRCKNAELVIPEAEAYHFPISGRKSIKKRPIVVGSGPAGLFCAYLLAENGYQPIILERGGAMEERVNAVTDFWNGAALSPETNVQFGEGGAGTFSDGKLNTLIKDTHGRYAKMLEIFVENGAPEEILYRSKPHIGTDCLRGVVTNMRRRMIAEWGAQFYFHSCLTDIRLSAAVTDGGARLAQIEVNHSEWQPCSELVLAVGHSARDTFSMLYRRNIRMEAKPFAVGLRIEHPQSMIDESQYGRERGKLPAADYKLTASAPSTGRGVYSFCMCPGGYVVNASSEEGRLAVNGMSNHSRDSANANSALIVTVRPEDYLDASAGALSGVAFQRALEERAFTAGGGNIPVQLFGDFRENRGSEHYGDILPCTKGAVRFANLRTVLPEFVSRSLLEGMEQFEHKIKGFSRYDALLSGVESRTSSPVRIVRGDNFESVSAAGIYPCGEGAGYAGGISSAAVDGMKIAEAIASNRHLQMGESGV